MTALSRRAHLALEPLHAFVYFVPEAGEEFGRLGLEAMPAGYFGSRAAPMGAVGPEVVVATFYNFAPSLIAGVIPAVWQQATPMQLVRARLRTADRALRRLLGDRLARDELADAAATAPRIAEGCTAPGRPLYAGHAELDWPDEPHLQLWHAATLLREFRGDGHIALLVAADLDPVEALVTHALGAPISAKLLRRSRAWSTESWAAAEDRLRGRGWLDPEGALTADGAAQRQAIEDRTDELADRPFRNVAGADVERMIDTCSGDLSALVDGGALPWHSPR